MRAVQARAVRHHILRPAAFQAESSHGLPELAVETLHRGQCLNMLPITILVITITLTAHMPTSRRWSAGGTSTLMELTAERVKQSQRDDADPWRIGNQALYDLCSRYPRHIDDAEIIAKIWLIGRTYAASIERGKGETVGLDISNDRFYTEHVTKVLRKSQLDTTLKALEGHKEIEGKSSIGRCQ